MDDSAITSIVSDERNTKSVFKYMVFVDNVCVMDKAITAIHWHTEMYVYIYDNVQE